MALKKQEKFFEILRMLEEGVPPKKIAAVLKVPYNTVITHKNRFFETILVRKETTPDPDQGSFFYNFWRKDRT